MDWVGRYVTMPNTQGCARLDHIGKGIFCIIDVSIHAFDIVMLCEYHTMHIWIQYEVLPIHPFIPWGEKYTEDEFLL